MIVKIKYQGTTRCFKALLWSEFLKSIFALFKFDEPIYLHYCDEEGDEVSISSELEWEYLVSTRDETKTGKPNPTTFYATPRDENPKKRKHEESISFSVCSEKENAMQEEKDEEKEPLHKKINLGHENENEEKEKDGDTLPKETPLPTPNPSNENSSESEYQMPEISANCYGFDFFFPFFFFIIKTEKKKRGSRRRKTGRGRKRKRRRRKKKKG